MSTKSHVWWTLYLSYVSEALEQLLFADGRDEFFEVEWLEVGHVFEAAGVEGLHGWDEHRRCFRPALAEVCVRVFDDICAFAGAVAYEQARALLEIFGEAVFVDDGRGCLGDLARGLPRRSAPRNDVLGSARIGRGKHGSVYFHAAGIDHWDDEAVGRSLDFARDDSGSLSDKGVEGADSEERLAGSEAEAFGCGYAHTKACVRARSHAHAHGVAIG